MDESKFRFSQQVGKDDDSFDHILAKDVSNKNQHKSNSISLRAMLGVIIIRYTSIQGGI